MNGSRNTTDPLSEAEFLPLISRSLIGSWARGAALLLLLTCAPFIATAYSETWFSNVQRLCRTVLLDAAHFLGFWQPPQTSLAAIVPLKALPAPRAKSKRLPQTDLGKAYLRTIPTTSWYSVRFDGQVTRAGQALPHARVMTRVAGQDMIVGETQADANGVYTSTVRCRSRIYYPMDWVVEAQPADGGPVIQVDGRRIIQPEETEINIHSPIDLQVASL